MTIFPVPQLSPEAQRVLAAAGLAPVLPETVGEATAQDGSKKPDGKPQTQARPAGEPSAVVPGPTPRSRPETPTAAAPAAPVRTPPAMPSILLPPQLAQAAGAAAQGAVLTQDSVAPLMANLAQIAEQPDLPAPLRVAVRAVMALQARPEAVATPQGLKQAIAASGLFLEARLAQPRPAGAPTGDLKAALMKLQQVVASLPRPAPEASARLVAKPATARPAADVSAGAVRAAAPTPPQEESPPASPPRTGAPQTPAAPAQAPVVAAQRSGAPRPPAAAPPPAATASEPAATNARPATPAGLFAPAAGPPAQAVAPAPPPAIVAGGRPADLEVPQPGPPQDGPDRPNVSPAAPAGRLPTPAGVATVRMASAGVSPEAPAIQADGGPAPREGPPVRTAFAATLRPAPPMAGAAPAPHPPARPSLAPDPGPDAIVRALAPQVEAAIARQELHQIASLPTARLPDEPPAAARWSFEVPLATPHGAAVAGFEIRRDAPDGEGDAGAAFAAAAPAWRVRFALDVEPAGPVEAQVVLRGGKAGVTLWAERPETARRLARDGERLSSALARASFETELAVRLGPAPRAPVAPGRFLDQAT